ncbi:MAG TPA: type II secretion system F family protein [Gaiellaceae bacterium]|nr:type II secretion system F family protein [Gaiellaceae bacterium]
MVLLLLLGAALVALAVFAALDALFSPAEARRASLRRVVTYATVSQAPRVAALERPRLREAVVPALSRVAQRLTPKGQRAKLQLRLEAAGLASRLDSEHFLALKTVLAVLSVAVALAAAGVSVGGLALGLVLVAASLFGPERALVRLARSRADRLTAHLPEVIDQIVISLEAGLAFDAAVSYFVRKGRSPLVAELRVLLSEVRMGDSRVEALKRLADRVPSDEMRNFVQTLVQSEGVGISRAAILRNQAADLRERRQLAAEERAHRMPIKILFPTVVFILPVMFVVVVGPALQQVATLLHD